MPLINTLGSFSEPKQSSSFLSFDFVEMFSNMTELVTQTTLVDFVVSPAQRRIYALGRSTWSEPNGLISNMLFMFDLNGNLLLQKYLDVGTASDEFGTFLDTPTYAHKIKILGDYLYILSDYSSISQYDFSCNFIRTKQYVPNDIPGPWFSADAIDIILGADGFLYLLFFYAQASDYHFSHITVFKINPSNLIVNLKFSRTHSNINRYQIPACITSDSSDNIYIIGYEGESDTNTYYGSLSVFSSTGTLISQNRFITGLKITSAVVNDGYIYFIGTDATSSTPNSIVGRLTLGGIVTWARKSNSLSSPIYTFTSVECYNGYVYTVGSSDGKLTYHSFDATTGNHIWSTDCNIQVPDRLIPGTSTANTMTPRVMSIKAYGDYLYICGSTTFSTFATAQYTITAGLNTITLNSSVSGSIGAGQFVSFNNSPYLVSVTSDGTFNGPSHGFVNDQQVVYAPSSLGYIVNAGLNTFQISSTIGGSPNTYTAASNPVVYGKNVVASYSGGSTVTMKMTFLSGSSSSAFRPFYNGYQNMFMIRVPIDGSDPTSGGSVTVTTNTESIEFSFTPSATWNNVTITPNYVSGGNMTTGTYTYTQTAVNDPYLDNVYTIPYLQNII